MYAETFDAVRGADAAAMPSLRICLAGYRSQPFCGGQGVYLRYLSKALTEVGHRVDVISGPPYPHLDPRVRLIELPSLNLFEAENHVTALRPRHLASFTDFFEWFSMLTGGFAEPYTFGRRLLKHLARRLHHYDLIHDNQSLCYGLSTLQRRGVPVVCTVHHPITRDRDIALAGAHSRGQRLLIRRWHGFLRMQQRVARRLDHIVTVSDSSRRDLAADFRVPLERIDVIHNGIDTEEFRPLAGVPRRTNRLMATASADAPLKGLSYLLTAYARLLRRHPDLELVVVGKLRQGGQTQRRLAALGISERVMFRSDLSHEELVRLYAEATIAVVPSLYEGFGLPAGEAMACEVPVVSTSGGALPEVVGDAGVLVAPGDAPALERAIDDLLASPARRLALGKAGRGRILRHFSWAVVARQMTRYYLKALRRSDADG